MAYESSSSQPERAVPFQRIVERFRNWSTGLIASPDFQRWASRFFLTRPIARRDAARLYDLVSGFVYSQTLLACVELDVLRALQARPMSAGALAARSGLSTDRMTTLCQSAAAIGLMTRQRDGTYRLGRLGAAALGVPGLQDMIRHHKVFYRDLTDPVGLLQGKTDPELSRFWPYVRGGDAAEDPVTAADYSALMATSQHLVAEETLDALPLDGIGALADIGGGTGMFLDHVAARYPAMQLHLFDLPAVIESARARLGADTAIRMTGGSFLTDPLPQGADAISLIRVLYDHDDHTVETLLRRVFDALPAGGQLILSEPMSGGSQPCRAGDAYFGFYTMAMTTGRPRSAERHFQLLADAGFVNRRSRRTSRPFLTSVITARKPG